MEEWVGEKHGLAWNISYAFGIGHACWNDFRWNKKKGNGGIMMGVRQGPENLHDVSPAKMIALFILESLPRWTPPPQSLDSGMHSESLRFPEILSELGPFLDLVVWWCRSNSNRYSGIRYSLAQLNPTRPRIMMLPCFFPKGFLSSSGRVTAKRPAKRLALETRMRTGWEMSYKLSTKYQKLKENERQLTSSRS